MTQVRSVAGKTTSQIRPGIVYLMPTDNSIVHL